MTTRHLVDPELVAILDTFPALTLTSETLPLIRTTLKEAMARHHASADMLDFSAISVSERFIPGPEGAPVQRWQRYISGCIYILLGVTTAVSGAQKK
jgi:hypothetical protein